VRESLRSLSRNFLWNVYVIKNKVFIVYVCLQTTYLVGNNPRRGYCTAKTFAVTWNPGRGLGSPFLEQLELPGDSGVERG
jgi:hypothetical protein